ncbi:hypothetical protein ACFE04_030884 [Oxalis oulophora]
MYKNEASKIRRRPLRSPNDLASRLMLHMVHEPLAPKDNPGFLFLKVSGSEDDKRPARSSRDKFYSDLSKTSPPPRVQHIVLECFKGYGGYGGYHGTSFEQTYRCYPASFIENSQIESGDKSDYYASSICFDRFYRALYSRLLLPAVMNYSKASCPAAATTICLWVPFSTL